MKSLKATLLIAVLAASLSACASQPPEAMNSTDRALTQTAISSTQSIKQLALIEQAQNPADVPLRVDTRTYGMNALATVRWSGPIGPLVDKIAKATGYTVRTIGNPPAIPIIVTANQTDQPIGDVLANIALQANKRETIVVLPGTREIVLAYTDN